jgi:hypothetical protein
LRLFGTAEQAAEKGFCRKFLYQGTTKVVPWLQSGLHSEFFRSL